MIEHAQAWLALAVIGAAEAVVHLARIRFAGGDRWLASGLAVWATCALRGLFVWVGVNVTAASPAAFLVAYAGTAAIATGACQRAAPKGDQER